MESANIPHHRLDLHQEQQQQQQQLLGPASSSSSSPSCDALTAHGGWYGASSNSSKHFAWSANSPHMNFVGNRIYQNTNTQLYKQYAEEKDENEEIKIPWSNNNSHNNTGCSIEDDHQQHQTLIPSHDQPSHKSKLDLFNSLLFPKFTDMISSTQSSIEDLQHLSPTCYMKNDHFQDLNQHDTKLLMKPAALLSPSGFMQPPFQVGQFLSGAQHCSGYGGPSSSPLIPSRGTFSQIFPSVNISNMNNNQSCTTISGSLDVNLQALDLLTSARFGGAVNHDQPQPHHLGLPLKETHAFAEQHMQKFEHRPTSSPYKLQTSFHGGSTTEAKRSQPEPQPSQGSSKKSRSESRACPPFKVRKEKLGDRVAALQQLVAPFGKTDTASVLMEAIGYIKFLQNQVETLSVPYMKSSRSRHIKPTQTGQMVDNDGSMESKRDLRSRGLCLVPLSCMSYVTNDDGGGWPSSEYHGGT